MVFIGVAWVPISQGLSIIQIISNNNKICLVISTCLREFLKLISQRLNAISKFLKSISHRQQCTGTLTLTLGNYYNLKVCKESQTSAALSHVHSHLKTVILHVVSFSVPCFFGPLPRFAWLLFKPFLSMLVCWYLCSASSDLWIIPLSVRHFLYPFTSRLFSPLTANIIPT